MSRAPFKTELEPELWHLVFEILRRVPGEIDVARCADDGELIDALGRGGWFDALRAYKRALEQYYAGTVFAALRAASLRPLCTEGTRSETTDFDDWDAMFQRPWDRWPEP